MSYFDRISDQQPYKLAPGLVARTERGERITLAVVDIDPGAVLNEHRHENEQLGIVLRGMLEFTVGGETRELHPGETWSIPSNTPHSAKAGPDGCTVIDVFNPPRADWEALERAEASPGRWP
jgi:quercetin dioxygenase-like cupin family protein